jgi:hypothetical protein
MAKNIGRKMINQPLRYSKRRVNLTANELLPFNILLKLGHLLFPLKIDQYSGQN